MLHQGISKTFRCAPALGNFHCEIASREKSQVPKKDCVLGLHQPCALDIHPDHARTLTPATIQSSFNAVFARIGCKSFKNHSLRCHAINPPFSVISKFSRQFPKLGLVLRQPPPSRMYPYPNSTHYPAAAEQ